mmetsp:Transcript_35842/g.47158  ORF Transcript_35842/g.47158 Transcript_35842/m.47158 type:complete len:82 (-) Transcript_35842:5013-5258(-)
MRECALEQKWKVVTAIKREAETNADDNNASKKKKDDIKGAGRRDKHDEISQAEQARRDEMTRHANVDIIWNDVTILSEKLS